MRLLIVQHGDALAKSVDPDRPLSEIGHRDIHHLSGYLGRRGIAVDRVLHSGKPRARQTAEMLAAELAPGGQVDAYPGLAPADPVAPIAEQAANWPGDALLVGHLPFVGKLVSQLITGRDSVEIVQFLPGSAVCLERADGTGWAIVWMIRPDHLG